MIAAHSVNIIFGLTCTRSAGIQKTAQPNLRAAESVYLAFNKASAPLRACLVAVGVQTTRQSTAVGETAYNKSKKKSESWSDVSRKEVSARSLSFSWADRRLPLRHKFLVTCVCGEREISKEGEGNQIYIYLYLYIFISIYLSISIYIYIYLYIYIYRECVCGCVYM